MQNKLSVIAIDLGATSGRAVLFTFTGDGLSQKEIHRFPNSIFSLQRKMYWDIYQLMREIITAFEKIKNESVEIKSIGVDTWGVDFGFIASDGELLGLPRAYRDGQTKNIPEEFFRIIPRRDVYDRTGIQIMDFNSLYQLYALHKNGAIAKQEAKSILFIPDLINYWLTGIKACEYTVASTSQLLNPHTHRFDPILLEAVGVTLDQFPEIVFPGTKIGELLPEYISRIGNNPISVIAVASHDTASAVAAVPASDPYFAYLSSGTWSLMGIETDTPIINDHSEEMNFTNEGGIEGTTRFLKNITGLWILEQFLNERKQVGIPYTYEEVINMAKSVSVSTAYIDPDHALFVAPRKMSEAIDQYCEMTNQQAPLQDAIYFRLIFDSLVLKYRMVMEKLKEFAPFEIRCLHIIGGGARNNYLNQMTANALSMPVIAGPVEATAIGNALVQAKSLGYFSTIQEMRDYIYKVSEMKVFSPEDTIEWDVKYEEFKSIVLEN